MSIWYDLCLHKYSCQYGMTFVYVNVACQYGMTCLHKCSCQYGMTYVYINVIIYNICVIILKTIFNFNSFPQTLSLITNDIISLSIHTYIYNS